MKIASVSILWCQFVKYKQYAGKFIAFSCNKNVESALKMHTSKKYSKQCNCKQLLLVQL